MQRSNEKTRVSEREKRTKLKIKIYSIHTWMDRMQFVLWMRWTLILSLSLPNVYESRFLRDFHFLATPYPFVSRCRGAVSIDFIEFHSTKITIALGTLSCVNEKCYECFISVCTHPVLLLITLGPSHRPSHVILPTASQCIVVRCWMKIIIKCANASIVYLRISLK